MVCPIGYATHDPGVPELYHGPDSCLINPVQNPEKICSGQLLCWVVKLIDGDDGLIEILLIVSSV